MATDFILNTRKELKKIDSLIKCKYDSLFDLRENRKNTISTLHKYEDNISGRKTENADYVDVQRAVSEFDMLIHDVERDMDKAISDRFKFTTDILSTQLLRLNIQIEAQIDANKKASKRQRNLTRAIIGIGVLSLLVTILKLVNLI